MTIVSTWLCLSVTFLWQNLLQGATLLRKIVLWRSSNFDTSTLQRSEFASVDHRHRGVWTSPLDSKTRRTIWKRTWTCSFHRRRDQQAFQDDNQVFNSFVVSSENENDPRKQRRKLYDDPIHSNHMVSNISRNSKLKSIALETAIVLVQSANGLLSRIKQEWQSVCTLALKGDVPISTSIWSDSFGGRRPRMEPLSSGTAIQVDARHGEQLSLRANEFVAFKTVWLGVQLKMGIPVW